MIQKAIQCFESTCGKAKVYVENDMAIGIFHDFLMLLKGNMVERMVAAQQEEVKQAEAQKQAEQQAEPQADIPQSESPKEE